MKKFVLYTARFGQPGRFKFPEVSIPDVDRFCFTDLDIEPGIGQRIPINGGKFKENDFYQIKKMDAGPLTAVMKQRQVKICIPDEIFDNYEYSVYVDCKRPKKADFEYLLSCMEPESDFLTRRHMRRDCAYAEGRFCINRKKDSETTIRKQLRFYGSKGFPTNNGLYATFILFRRHTKKLKEFSKMWWEQVEKYSFRDQISLPYVVWKHGMKISLCEREGSK